MMINQGTPDHIVVQMPEAKKRQSEFIKERCKEFTSVMDDVRNQERGSSSRRTKPLIQRVSKVLKEMKSDFKKCFEPRLVALGPLHHGNPKFDRAEPSKLKFAAVFAYENKTTCDFLFGKVMEEIQDLRNCYKPNEIEVYDDEKLAWMLFIDGCAVLCYGLKGDFEKLNTKVDRLVFAQLDLFLLENQIPYRVLQILINSAIEPEKWKQSITDFIRDDKDKRDSNMIGQMLLKCGDRRKHRIRKTFRSIKELKESGIHVKPNKTNNLKNISFYCRFLGKIRMPHLLVDDSTAAMFMNLVALEMCRDFDNEFEVTSYLCFLDSLIDTAEDVKELRVAGMLHNYLGSDEEVADLFNKMSRDLVPDQDTYSAVVKDIHSFCNNPWTPAAAQVYYSHFSSPWTFLALMGAIISLLFSAIQAYFSLPGNRPENERNP
ncbi:Tetratricopeptide repeat (TPR)-like superfamily protein [Hibiscus syriacus]|uniref:Tetratricopeptide repeat (TPR)-like superfamily protein n=1 Tax=Hibiscus syriacus TaxID=106335 RepID=A0A6A3AEE4_HIBSY|nr:Tetratricopeptide repeat (TPR)-like superfamily protein [Hibiscus syriacus]